MTLQTLPNTRFLTRMKCLPEAKPDCLEAFHLQEQFTGLVPLRNERSATNVRAERLTGTSPAGTSLIFIP